MAEYRLSPAAERDLEGIWRYTHREWGLEQADRYTDLLITDYGIAIIRILHERMDAPHHL